MDKMNKGQNLIEYTLILGLVAVALFSMQTYFKRGIQSVVKVVADDYGPYGPQGEGEILGDREKAVKAQELEGKIATSSTSNSSSTQKVTNLGNGVILTKISSSTDTKTESFAVGGDYRKKQ
jgi:Flp pilus assembly pilin Flp